MSDKTQNLVDFITNQNTTSGGPNPLVSGTRILRSKLLEAQAASGTVASPAVVAQVAGPRSCLPRINYYRYIDAAGGNFNFGNTLTFKFSNAELSRCDMVLELVISAFGGAGASSAQGNTTYFYCDYPGVRMCRTVTHNRRNVEWDSYTPMDVMLYRKFEVPIHKRNDWDISMGQQVAKTANVYQPDAQIFTEARYFDGPQTRKTRQPELTLMIPIIIESGDSEEDSLYYGGPATFESSIVIQLDNGQKIFYEHNPLTNTISPINLSSVPAITKARLHINELSVIPEYKTALTATIGASRMWRRRNIYTKTVVSVNTTVNTVQLTDIRDVVETLYVGFRSPANDSDPRTWHKFGIATSSTAYLTYIPGVINDLTDVNAPKILVQLPMERVQQTSMASQIGFSIGDIPMAEMKSLSFYGNYLPTKQPNNVGGNDDPQTGVLYFGTRNGRNCNGSVDFKTKNNLQLLWQSTYVGQVEIVVSAVVIRYFRC